MLDYVGDLDAELTIADRIDRMAEGQMTVSRPDYETPITVYACYIMPRGGGERGR